MSKKTIELKANEEKVVPTLSTIEKVWELYKKQHPVKYAIKKANGEMDKSLAGK